jgi:hypothetical protein
MEERFLRAFLATLAGAAGQKDKKSESEVVSVSETVSAAASVYENVRNALEYDEEHLLRRNAIRRILKRRFGEENVLALSSDLLHELIWARYFPNNSVPVKIIDEVAAILKKFQPLFARAEETRERNFYNHWLLDVLSTEIEYKLSPPSVDEALASLAFQNLKARLTWSTATIKSEDQELQLYIAVHRAVLKSNQATLRFRVFSLYFSDWLKNPSPESLENIAKQLPQIIESVENQLCHLAGDRLFRFVRRRSVVFLVLRDLGEKYAGEFDTLLFDEKKLRAAVAETAARRYDNFRARVNRSIIRAILFILLTKTILALIVELPYDRLIAKDTSWTPLLTNILFHPALLAVIGFSVSIPEKKNTELIYAELRTVLGLDPAKTIKFSSRRGWSGGAQVVFDLLYVLMFLLFIGAVSYGLYSFGFNAVSTFFFIFFLSLVTFFGFKIRGSRRELVMIEGSGGFSSAAFDIFFLPIVRAGRWISLRAPRVNILLFFFDFIIEAPFKAAIKLVEGWLAFLKEKKEEI